jgi:cyclopropane fatty-acyl-phospholipid synthase-like methyltransferase
MSMLGVARGVWARILPEPVKGFVRSSRHLDGLKMAVRDVLKRHAPYDEVYDDAFYAELGPSAKTSAEVMARSLIAEFRPKTLVEFGCGAGALLAEFKTGGVDVLGLEYSDAGLRLCKERQLNVRKFDLTRDSIADRFEIAASIEVAEHLPAAFADRLVQVVSGAAPLVVFTAATPGQGGNEHVNEQPHEYWIEKFRNRDMEFDEAVSERIRADWKTKDVIWWFHQNLMIFRSRSVAQT